ncbi:FG-GAP repeat domain-containing protein, partial [Verrucomicrobiota bacterium]
MRVVFKHGGESWGGLGYEPVSGDFDGDGIWDLAVYYEPTGQWFIRTASGDPIVWAQQWGGLGYEPVFGDYNGDGVSDMAVYHEATGKWYIYSIDGTIVLWDGLWGGPGYVPVGR